MQRKPTNKADFLPDVRGKNIAFDLDGTLVEGDSGDSVFYHLLLDKLRQLVDFETRDEVHLCWEDGRLAQILSLHLALIDHSQQSLAAYKLATRILERFPARVIEDTAKEILNLGRQPKKLKFVFEWPRGVQNACAVLYGARFYPGTVSLAREVQARGGIVWLVSASPQKVVESCCEMLGLPRQRALGMVTLSARAGFSRYPWAGTKVEVLRAAGVDQLEIAFGNSLGDLEMLQMAKQAAVVATSAPEVLEIAQRRGWEILNPDEIYRWNGKSSR